MFGRRLFATDCHWRLYDSFYREFRQVPRDMVGSVKSRAEQGPYTRASPFKAHPAIVSRLAKCGQSWLRQIAHLCLLLARCWLVVGKRMWHRKQFRRI